MDGDHAPYLPSNTQSNLNLTAGFAGSRSAALVLEGSSGTFTVFSTLDGGRMWTRSRSIHAGYSGGIVDIQFLNRLHGFLEVSDPGNSMLSGALYATKNGGRTWQRVSYSGATQNATTAASDAAVGKPQLGWLPFAEEVSFRTIEDGWMSGGQRGGPFGEGGYVWLFRTTDGGRSWSHESLPMPRGWSKSYTTLSEPQWFGNTGYLTMTCWGLKAAVSQTFLYVTHDAGRQWTQIPFIHNEGSQTPFSVDFVTARAGYAMYGGALGIYKKRRPHMDGVETCGSAALTSALTEFPVIIYFGHGAASCALALLHRVHSGHSPQRGRLFKHSECPSASISA